MARKQKRNTPNLGRNKPQKNEKPKILIVCEGKNTEPSYFEAFKVATVKLVIDGSGSNTISLVEKAERLNQKAEYEEVWCVFDHDPKPSNPKQSQNFDNAVKKAESLGFLVGYSNQAFEYWLLLHFKNHQGSSMPRTDYADELNTYWEEYDLKYDKNSKIITSDMFDVLQNRQDEAIKRAKKIHEMHQEDSKSPAQSESSTTVYLLVEKLKDL